MRKERIPKNHENKEMCKDCDGVCCKNMSCQLFPSDFKKISKALIIAKIKEGFCFDYWEGNPTCDKKFDNVIAYYMRPKHKGHEHRIVEASWGGECIFLEKNGCSLKERCRPSGGKALIPNHPQTCKGVEGYSKRDCAIDWLPYNKLILEVLEEFDNGKRKT